MGKNNQNKTKATVTGRFTPSVKPAKFVEIKGNLITLAKAGEFDYIGHGCNCFATMGAGIALPISIAFPNAKIADKEFEAPSFVRLGNFTIGRERLEANAKRSSVKIVNFYSQYEPGRAFDKEALILGLRKFNLMIKSEKNTGTISLGLPLIGCGIAGGDWDEVREIIREEFMYSQVDVTIVHFVEDES